MLACLILKSSFLDESSGVPSQQRPPAWKHPGPQRSGQQAADGEALGSAWSLHEDGPEGHSEGRPQHEEVAGPRSAGQEICLSEQRRVSGFSVHPHGTFVTNKYFIKCIASYKCCLSFKSVVIFRDIIFNDYTFVSVSLQLVVWCFTV